MKLDSQEGLCCVELTDFILG